MLTFRIIKNKFENSRKHTSKEGDLEHDTVTTLNDFISANSGNSLETEFRRIFYYVTCGGWMNSGHLVGQIN